jgi:nuclear transcription Y subunit beta
MKKVLPLNAKIAKDSKEAIQECVSEFISFITSEASDKCTQEKRKTINGDDILWAMSTLGFDRYYEPLKIYLAKYRESVKGEKPDKKGTMKKDSLPSLMMHKQPMGMGNPLPGMPMMMYPGSIHIPPHHSPHVGGPMIPSNNANIPQMKMEPNSSHQPNIYQQGYNPNLQGQQQPMYHSGMVHTQHGNVGGVIPPQYQYQSQTIQAPKVIIKNEASTENISIVVPNHDSTTNASSDSNPSNNHLNHDHTQEKC